MVDERRRAVVVGDIFRKRHQTLVESISDFWMGLNDISLFANVAVEVVQSRGFSVFRVEFPLAGSNRIQLISLMIKEGFMRRF